MIDRIEYRGAASPVAAVPGGFVAGYERFEVSQWVACCFMVLPPIFVLLLLPTDRGPCPRRPTLDEVDALVGLDGAVHGATCRDGAGVLVH